MTEVESRKSGAEKKRLAQERSPYLLQHADNPVDWYPWGEEAFAKAKEEDKPIFLSIGYSACHWCHVMAHESFEDEAIASLMNAEFVNIKLDREERPDIDDIYMSFVQMATGGGGWPMSVFLTPDLKPFYGGTYFPPRDGYGRPGFPTLLQGIAEAWRTKRAEIDQASQGAVEQMHLVLGSTPPKELLRGSIIEDAAKSLLSSFDPVNGGFGGAPKFPPSYSLSLLMRYYRKSGDQQALRAVTHTLDRMASGGMYDQLGGGFHRYSVDATWLVPHFEKMLYDNALLAFAYLEAHQLTGENRYCQVAVEILDYVLRDMTDVSGGFHSAEDADSEGTEGKFYVWRPTEIMEILGAEDGRLFCDFYDVTETGNFEDGASILHLRANAEIFAERYQLTHAELNRKLAEARRQLLDLRNGRVRPGKDDKVLADWNGLMLSVLSKGYQVTSQKRFLEAALRCADFIERHLYSDAGLKRTYRKGESGLHGFLTDYSFVANGLVDLYEASFDWRWLRLADKLAADMVAKFCDREEGGFYMTLEGQSDLLVRQKDTQDGAIPAGNSVAALLLCRLSVLLGNSEYREIAGQIFAATAAQVNRLPRAFVALLNAYDFYSSTPSEIALVGSVDSKPVTDIIQGLHSEYFPNKSVALLDPGSPQRAELEKYLPLLASKTLVDGKPAAYLCRNFVCNSPVSTATELLKQLRNG